jgi:hypothetical protein
MRSLSFRGIDEAEESPDKACSPATPANGSRGRLRRVRKIRTAGTLRFFEVGSELWQLPVTELVSPQPPGKQAVSLHYWEPFCIVQART